MCRGLCVENLDVYIDSKAIIKGFNLYAEPGEVIGLAGEVGSGKTTLLKVLTGLIPELYKGFVVHGDISIFGYSPSEALAKGLVAYVPQDPYTFFIGSTPAEEASILGIDIDKFVFTPKSVAHVDIDKLSDGQLYRLLIDSAIALKPRLIAFDEPLSHIDSWTAQELLENIRAVAMRDKAIVLVADHRVDMLRRFTDRVVYLSNIDKCSDIMKLDDSPCSRESVVSLRGSIGYRDRAVLSNVSVDMWRGHTICFVGRNGSGKTTLLKALAGLVKVHGKRYVARGTRFFIIPQRPIYWFPPGTVEDVLKRFARVYKSSVSVDDATHLFGLENMLNRHVYSLSVGEARLLSVAIAYISKADVILFDEPTLGLDCYHLNRVLHAMRILVEECKAVAVATHDMLFAKAFTDVYRVESGYVYKA